MPVQTADTNNVTFEAENQQWIVKSGVVVSTTAADGIAVSMPRGGGQLLNHGDVSSTGEGGRAIDIGSLGRGALVVNSESGTLTGSTGIVVEARDTNLLNQGSIIGLAKYGIEYTFSAGPGEIHNSGYIYGKASAIFAGSLDAIAIVNSGVIESGGDAVSIGLTQSAGRVVNTGTIIAGGYAIKSDLFRSMKIENSGSVIGDVLLKGFDPQKVVNNGLIAGDVTFGTSADVYRGRGGVLDGKVFGGGGNDTLKGGAGVDEFFGQNGQDELFGRGGDDTLCGGEYGDRLKGGGGADTFVYEKTSDSRGGASADTRLDTILDFRSGQGDKIDFSRIEVMVGDVVQKLEFIGEAAFSGRKGEVRYEVKGNNVFVQLDATGGKRPELEIKLKGVSALHASDFDL